MAESTLKPTRKLTAVGISSLITTIVISLVSKKLHYDMDANEAAAVTGIINMAVGYLTPNKTPQEP